MCVSVSVDSVSFCASSPVSVWIPGLSVSL